MSSNKKSRLEQEKERLAQNPSEKITIDLHVTAVRL